MLSSTPFRSLFLILFSSVQVIRLSLISTKSRFHYVQMRGFHLAGLSDVHIQRPNCSAQQGERGRQSLCYYPPCPGLTCLACDSLPTSLHLLKLFPSFTHPPGGCLPWRSVWFSLLSVFMALTVRCKLFKASNSCTWLQAESSPSPTKEKVM